jgi:heptosyltransferase-1
MKRILILKRSSFGDIIHALPVIPALRKYYPEAKITWLTEVGYGPFLRSVQGIDTVVEIGFRSMLRQGQLDGYLRRLRRLRKEGPYDALIDLQGTLKSWLLLLRMRAARKIGFNRADAREPQVTRFYTEQAPPMPAGLHVIRMNLKLLETVGVNAEELVFPSIGTERSDADFIAQWLCNSGLSDGSGFIIVNPFTAWPTKDWPLEHAASLCRMIERDTRLKCVVIHGPKEAEKAREVAAKSEGSALPAPPTNLGLLTAILRLATAYVGGDTGPTQLAAALGVPIVAVFGPTDPQRNGPFDPADVVIWVELACKRCRRNRCYESIDRWAECMRRITPEMVMASLLLRLQAAGRKPRTSIE